MAARITVDVDAVDIPTIAVIVGKAMSFLKFTKGCEFIVPKPKKKAIWPDGEADAEDSGIDLNVHPWTWWIVADGYAQVGVTFEPSIGNSYVLEITDGRMDTALQITPDDAKNLFATLKESMKDMRANLRVGTEGIFKPADKMLEYHVKTWVYRHTDSAVRLPPHGPFPPRFR